MIKNTDQNNPFKGFTIQRPGSHFGQMTLNLMLLILV